MYSTLTNDFTYLSGTVVPFDIKLIADALRTESIYLGFARSSPSWGQACLIKFKLDRSKWPVHYIERFGGTGKYNDLMSRELGYDSGSRRIFIARIPKNVGDSDDINDFEFIDEMEIGQIYCLYMNDSWMLVEGLRPQYYFDLDYEYYIFPASKDVDLRLKILKVSHSRFAERTVNCHLAYAVSENADYPTSFIDAGNLKRVTNSLGEDVITNMNAEFDVTSEMRSYTFFIVNDEGTPIYPPLKYVETVITPYEKFHIFEYKSVLGKTIKLKMTTNLSYLESFAVFHESSPFLYYSMPISDNNPPPLKAAYLRDFQIDKSILDVLGIIKVFKNEVKFARILQSEAEAHDYSKNGWLIDEIEISESSAGSNETAKIVFALTDDYDKALEGEFNSIFIEKEVDPDIPTDKIYRELFLCFAPRDKDGHRCFNNWYSRSDLFNPSKHSFDIGTLIYIARKVPVYRKYISGKEKFILLI